MSIEVSQPEPETGKRPVARPIDMMHLTKQALGDVGLEGEILRNFDEILAAHFGHLEGSSTVPELLHHLHIIRGASVGVGAWSLAEHAHVMETELNEGEPVNPERVEDIHFAVEEVRTFVVRRIAEIDAEIS